jgi:CBS-domain-containing membrane protein
VKPEKSDDAEVDRPSQTRDVLSFKVLTIGPDVPIRDVARLLLGRQIRMVSVINCDGLPIGTVSEGGLIGRGFRAPASTRACRTVERLH